ncbi:hypothetical protein CPB84DRAFT_1965714 [Gymnopilus junonius]|uniref:DUF8205 domain-containing protein n=1 Tax=Gymnopilus junonius TaxID=109634 RepID=A0A9P5TIM4_GYMJU|nr:hypothetical protein CPB84DRAFT_1965714 [Gymnopilus junonius]
MCRVQNGLVLLQRRCQKEHWPIHKEHCKQGLGEGIGPLIKSVTGNPMLSHYIQVCLSLQFRLHQLHRLQSEADRKKIIRAMHLAHIDVGIEPSKITDFMNLYHFKNWDKPDMEGMLQFHDLVSPWPGLPEGSVSEMHYEMWKTARTEADEEGGSHCAVVLIQFANNFQQSIVCPFIIGEDAIDTARRAPSFTMVSALSGKEIVYPMNIASCFEYMNTHIRSDKNDRLRLRAPMREIDKELIRKAGKEPEEGDAQKLENHAVRALRVKVGREYVYKSQTMKQIQEDRRTAAVVRATAVGEERQIEGVPQEQQANPGQKLNRAERRRLERELKKEQKRRQ